ncbi:MAG: chromate resistance protein [Actinomycetia bacterium]|nr:chromate resistance protein [Actinomycetes bacterium]
MVDSRNYVTMVTSEPPEVDWVTLVYRVPRQPSTPRIAIWRRLRALGVAQLGDGVVALPQDARTREHLEWVADRVIEAGGSALLLRSRALSRMDERAMAQAMAQARADEYRHLADLASETVALVTTPSEATRALKRLRKELRAIQRRDYFPPPQRDVAWAAIERLADTLATVQAPATSEASPS